MYHHLSLLIRVGSDLTLITVSVLTFTVGLSLDLLVLELDDVVGAEFAVLAIILALLAATALLVTYDFLTLFLEVDARFLTAFLRAFGFALAFGRAR